MDQQNPKAKKNTEKNGDSENQAADFIWFNDEQKIDPFTKADIDAAKQLEEKLNKGVDEDLHKNILLVEDEPFISDLYKHALTSSHFKVTTAGTGTDGLKMALDAAAKNQLDLVILDIILPGMSGLEVLKKLRANSATKNTPILLLTNLGQESVIQEGFEDGATEYIIKSRVTPAEMIKHIYELIENNHF